MINIVILMSFQTFSSINYARTKPPIAEFITLWQFQNKVSPQEAWNQQISKG